MDVHVTLGGHRAPWRYRGSTQLQEWLESQPWLRGGGCQLVQVGTSGDREILLDSIRCAVRAADDGGFAPRVPTLTVDERLVEFLKLEFCGSANASDRELADSCAIHPQLVVAFTSTQGTELLRDASVFSDRARKFAPDFRTAFVFLSSSRHSDGNAVDLEVGSPNDHVLRLLDETQERLFRAYLHARIAWETAGSLSLARRLDSALQDCRIGDDEGVESGLNGFAQSQYALVPQSSKILLDQLLVAVSRNSAPDLRRRAIEGRQEGILWSPFGRDRLRIVPWVARAVLMEDPRHTCAQMLRSHIWCAPLARELLGRCLELEARERAKLSWALGNTSPPTEAVARLAAFERADVDSDTVLYPICSPVRPTDAWAFAEFGTFIEAAVRSKIPDLPRRDLHALRHLRNALAHGHYASWSALKRLLEIERRLGITL